MWSSRVAAGSVRHGLAGPLARRPPALGSSWAFGWSAAHVSRVGTSAVPAGRWGAKNLGAPWSTGTHVDVERRRNAATDLGQRLPTARRPTPFLYHSSRYGPDPKKFNVGATGLQLLVAEAPGGGFGAKIWPSAKLLVAYMASHGGLKDRRVLELGCGVGLAGITAAALGGRVVLTDRDVNVLDRAKGNIELNRKAIAAAGGAASATFFEWGEEHSMSKLLAEHGPFDFIIGADILYSRSGYGPLIQTIDYLSSPRVGLPLHELVDGCAHGRASQPTVTLLACPERDTGLGPGYGGRYFGAIASGEKNDKAEFAKANKLPIFAFGPPERQFHCQTLQTTDAQQTYLIELRPKE